MTSDPRPSAALMYSTYVLAGVGFFLAGLNGTATGALHVVTLVNVGLVGVVSFLRHVISSMAVGLLVVAVIGAVAASLAPF